MEIINVYIDGPSLLGVVNDIRKKRIWLDPFRLSRLLINKQLQQVKKIYYAETPYQENLHNPETFRKQQRFFGKIHTYIQDGKVNHITGVYRLDTIQVPRFIVNY